jgi:hypothetical protein
MKRALKEIQSHLSDGNGLYWTRAFRGTRSSMRALDFPVDRELLVSLPPLPPNHHLQPDIHSDVLDIVVPPVAKRFRAESEEETKLHRLTEYLELPAANENQPDETPTEQDDHPTVYEVTMELPIDPQVIQHEEGSHATLVLTLEAPAASVRSVEAHPNIDFTPAWEALPPPDCVPSIVSRDLLDPCPCGSIVDAIAVESLTSFGAVIRLPTDYIINSADVAVPMLSQPIDEIIQEQPVVSDVEVTAVQPAGSQSTELQTGVDLEWDHEFTLECEGTEANFDPVVMYNIEELFPETEAPPPPSMAAAQVEAAPPEDCTICLLPLSDVPVGQSISKRATTALILHIGDIQGDENKTFIRMPCCNCAVHAACLERCVQLRNVRKVCCGCFQALTDQHLIALEDFFEDTLKMAEGFRSHIIGGISTLGMFSVVSRPVRMKKH